MTEMENNSNGVATETRNLNFYEKFTAGEFGLAKTYWLLGVLPAFFVGLAMRMVSTNTSVFWIGALFIGYQLILLVAIWNAGKKYKGSRVWPVLAFLMVLTAVVRNIGPILEIGKN